MEEEEGGGGGGGRRKIFPFNRCLSLSLSLSLRRNPQPSIVRERRPEQYKYRPNALRHTAKVYREAWKRISTYYCPNKTGRVHVI